MTQELSKSTQKKMPRVEKSAEQCEYRPRKRRTINVTIQKSPRKCSCNTTCEFPSKSSPDLKGCRCSPTECVLAKVPPSESPPEENKATRKVSVQTNIVETKDFTHQKGQDTREQFCQTEQERAPSPPPSCVNEAPYKFPYLGRTPSGNLKIDPRMISHDNEEFGILVANPEELKAHVQKIPRKGQKPRKCSCPPKPPPPLGTCPRISRIESSDSLKTAKNSPSTEYLLEKARKTARKSRRKEETQREAACWNYVNPKYKEKSRRKEEETCFLMPQMESWNYVNPKYKERKEEKTGIEEKPPKAPHFPQEKLTCPKPAHKKCRPPAQRFENSQRAQDETKMGGQLRYVVKGKVCRDATIALGNELYPVESVLFEIRPLCEPPPPSQVESGRAGSWDFDLPPGFYSELGKRMEVPSCTLTEGVASLHAVPPQMNLNQEQSLDMETKNSESFNELRLQVTTPNQSITSIGTPALSQSKTGRNPGSRRTLFNADTDTGVMPNMDVITERVLCFGGINPDHPYSPSNTGRNVLMYTRELNDWEVIGALPVSRTHFGLARIGNDIYVIGGLNPEQVNSQGKSTQVATNFRLSLRSGQWTEAAPLDEPRSHFGCVSEGPYIYVIGGNLGSGGPTTSCLRFSPEENKWEGIASLPSTRANMGIAVFDNRIVVAGGTVTDTRKIAEETVMSFHPAQNSWSSMKSLPKPTAFCSLIFHQDLFLFAGAVVNNISTRKNTSTPTIYRYDTHSQDWTAFGDLLYARHAHCCTVLKDSVVVIGGISSRAAGPINAVEIWQPSTGSQFKALGLPRSRTGMRALTL